MAAFSSFVLDATYRKSAEQKFLKSNVTVMESIHEDGIPT